MRSSDKCKNWLKDTVHKKIRQTIPRSRSARRCNNGAVIFEAKPRVRVEFSKDRSKVWRDLESFHGRRFLQFCRRCRNVAVRIAKPLEKSKDILIRGFHVHSQLTKERIISGGNINEDREVTAMYLFGPPLMESHDVSSQGNQGSAASREL